MYELSVETWFAGAHSLREYQGSCERLHGHNWRVEVSVEAEKLDSIGLAVDFRLLREKVEAAVQIFDHTFLNENPPFDKLNPSAENIAKFFYDGLSKELNDGNVRVSRVKVWESEKCAASYYE